MMLPLIQVINFSHCPNLIFDIYLCGCVSAIESSVAKLKRENLFNLRHGKKYRETSGAGLPRKCMHLFAVSICSAAHDFNAG